MDLVESNKIKDVMHTLDIICESMKKKGVISTHKRVLLNIVSKI